MKIKLRYIFLGLTALFQSMPFFSSPLLAQSKTDLPKIEVVEPSYDYQVLGPVGAAQRKLEAARRQLRLEAQKMSADAIINVKCTPNRIRRDGLTWIKEDAYCRGLAIRMKKS